MKKSILTLFILAAAILPSTAQTLDHILSSIESNNNELKALRKDHEAADADRRADNRPGGPSVEYSPFWQKNVSGLSSSELIVSQEFDFPTLYASRSKTAEAEAEALDLRYLEARRELLLVAKLGCIELVKLRRARKLMEQRLEYARSVTALVDKMASDGNATALDINKVRMEQMSLQGAAEINAGEQLAIEQSLTAMNASLPLEFDGIDYPEATMIGDFESFRSRALAGDAFIAAARGEAVAAGRQASLAGREWLPSLTMGYRRNTAPGEAQNGFIVGMSFPVWSTGQRTRAARARRTAAELRADEATREVETRIRAQYDELLLLEKTIRAYDENLMEETLRLLAKSLEASQITVLQYFTEADAVYAKMEELIDARYRYNAILASLTRSEL